MKMGLLMVTCPHNPTGRWFMDTENSTWVESWNWWVDDLEQPHQVRYQVRYVWLPR